MCIVLPFLKLDSLGMTLVNLASPLYNSMNQTSTRILECQTENRSYRLHMRTKTDIEHVMMLMQ